MSLQKSISCRRLKRFNGKKVKVLIDALPKRKGYDYVGRTEGNAPEIDSLVYIKGKNLNPGDYLAVKVIKSSDYDLFAKKD